MNPAYYFYRFFEKFYRARFSRAYQELKRKEKDFDKEEISGELFRKNIREKRIDELKVLDERVLELEQRKDYYTRKRRKYTFEMRRYQGDFSGMWEELRFEELGDMPEGKITDEIQMLLEAVSIQR